MKELITILFSLITFETISAQVTQEWVARYNGPGNSEDYSNSIALYGSGNTYVTGQSYASGAGGDLQQ